MPIIERMKNILLVITILTVLSNVNIRPEPMADRDFQCAYLLLSQTKEPGEKAEALVEIAKLYLENGDKAAADKLLFESLKWVVVTPGGLFRAGALGDVLEIASVEHLKTALDIGRPITGSDGIWALRQLIVAHSRLGLSKDADALLTEGIERTIKRNKKERWYGDQDFELAQLLVDGVKAGLVERALRIGRGIKNPFVRGDVLSAVAVKLAEDKSYRKALIVARSIHYEIERIDALVEVANAAIKSGSKSSATKALSYALFETRKDIFDSEQDTKAKALVSISLAYDNNGQRIEALRVLEHAEKVAHTIGKPGFKDAGLSQVALAYARSGNFDKALQVTEEIPSPWSDVKSNTLATIASYMLGAGEQDKALSVVAQALQIAKDIDCTYFKYGISARSCFGGKASDFIKIASVYEKRSFFGNEAEALDLAVLLNKYKNNPPHQIIEEGSSVIGSDPVGELEIIKGYLASGHFKKAIEVTSTMKDGKARVVAVAIIEFKLTKEKDNSASEKELQAHLGCKLN